MWEEITNATGKQSPVSQKHTALLYAPLATVAANLDVCDAVQARSGLAGQQQVLL